MESIQANFVQEGSIQANFQSDEGSIPANFSKLPETSEWADNSIGAFGELIVAQPIKGVASIVAGLGALAQKPLTDSGRALGNMIGMPSSQPIDPSPMGYSNAFTGAMHSTMELAEKTPLLRADTPGRKLVAEGIPKLIEEASDYLGNNAAKLSKDDQISNLLETVARAVPETAMWASMALPAGLKGKGKAAKPPIVGEDANIGATTTTAPKPIAPELRGQGELPLEHPTQSTTLPPNYAEKGMLELQKLKEEAQVSKEQISPPGDLFSPGNIEKSREARRSSAEETFLEGIARAEEAGLVKEAEIPLHRKKAEDFFEAQEKQKRLEEDLAWADHDFQKRQESTNRQYEIYDSFNMEDVYSKGAFKKTTGKDTLLHTFGSEEMRRNFNKWFGAGKVTNEDGSPKRVYHSTSNNFDTFKVTSDIGFHFGANYHQSNARLDNNIQFGNIAGEPSTIISYLNLKNPLRLPDLGTWSPITFTHEMTIGGKRVPSALERAGFPRHEILRIPKTAKGIRKYIESKGFDGIVYENMVERQIGQKGGDSYIAFHPEQIKSATGNRGTYDPKDPNYLHSFGDKELRGKLLDKLLGFTLNKDTGYETQHTGKVVKSDEAGIYVRDVSSEKIHKIGPEDVTYMHSLSPDMGQGASMGEFLTSLKVGAANYRMPHVFEMLEKLPENQKTGDISPRFGMANAANRSSNPAFYRRNGPRAMANWLSLAFDNSLFDYVATERAYNHHDVVKSIVPLQEAYQFGKLSNQAVPGMGPKYDLFKKHMGTLNNMTKDSPNWFNGKDYYPDDAYLLSKGMEKDFVPVWRSMFETFENLWAKEVEAATNNGFKIPERIPGYMPHEFKGPYRVKLYTINAATGKGGERYPEKQYVGEVNFYNRSDRDKAHSYLESLPHIQQQMKSHDVFMEKVDPQPSGRDTGGMMSGMREGMMAMENSPGLKKLAELLWDSASRGIITSILERSPAPKWGHTLDRVGYDPKGPLGLSKTDMRSAMDLFRRYTEDVNGWLVRSRFVNEVWAPLHNSKYMTDFPDLAKFVESATKEFAKIDDTMSDKVNTQIRAGFIKTGMDPALGAHLANTLTGTTSMIYLLFKPFYWLANMAQRVGFNYPTLLTLKAQSELLGGPKGSILKAFVDKNKNYHEWSSLDPNNKKMSPQLRYAIEHGHIDPGFNDMITPGRVRDPVSIYIERRTRADAFMTMYYYAKQFMAEGEALKAAGKHADAVGVPYSAQFGQQLAVANLGLAAKPLAIFTNYASHVASKSNEIMNTAYQGIKANKASAAAKALGALGAWQLAQYSMFGINGINGMQNLSDILRWANLNGYDIKLPEDWARDMDDWFPDFFRGMNQYGLATIMQPQEEKFNASASGGGFNIAPPTAMVNALKTAVDSLILSGKWMAYEAGMTDRPVTAKDSWEVGRTAPGTVRGIWEQKLKAGGLYNLAEDILTGEFPSSRATNYPGDGSAQKDILMLQGKERSYLGSWLNLLFGYSSMDEASFKQSVRLQDMKENKYKQMVSQITQMVKEKGEASPRDLAKLIDMGADYGENHVGPLLLAIIESQFRAQLKPDALKAWDARSSKEKLMRYMEYLDERSREPNRGR